LQALLEARAVSKTGVLELFLGRSAPGNRTRKTSSDPRGNGGRGNRLAQKQFANTHQGNISSSVDRHNAKRLDRETLARHPAVEAHNDKASESVEVMEVKYRDWGGGGLVGPKTAPGNTSLASGAKAKKADKDQEIQPAEKKGTEGTSIKER